MTRQKRAYCCNHSADDLNLTKQERQSAGAFHTPKALAIKMAKKLFPRYAGYKTKQEIIDKFGEEGTQFVRDFRLIDPCCGTGNLLAAALNVYKWIEEEDIYGVDIDPRAVEFCIKKFPNGHFQVGDCLIEDLTDDRFWQQPSDGMFGVYKAQMLAEATRIIKDKTVKNRAQVSVDILKKKQMVQGAEK